MSFDARVTQLLQSGFNALDLTLAPEPFERYLHLLQKWNQTYNLTAVRDIDAMVTRHVLDSLAVLPWVQGGHVLDVGSGAGLPGIPIALAHPQWHVTLLDSNGKKTRFLEECRRFLELTNVTVVQSRAENYHPALHFDTVVSRALGDLQSLVANTNQIIQANGIWVAMKGCYPEEELKAIKQPYRVEIYTVPGLNESRCCVVIQQNAH